MLLIMTYTKVMERGRQFDKPTHDHPWQAIKWTNSRRANTGDVNKSGFNTLAGAKSRARLWLKESGANKPETPKTGLSNHFNVRITKDANGDNIVEVQKKYCEKCAPEVVHEVKGGAYGDAKSEIYFTRLNNNVYPKSDARKYTLPNKPTETPPPHRMDV